MGERGNGWPPVVHAIVADAVATLRPRRIWVFGSRGRGEARPGSDIDMAFELAADDPAAWKTFCRRVRLDARTLHPVDLVNLAHVGASLRATILSEGMLVYEQH